MMAAVMSASAKYVTIADTLRASRIFPGTKHAFTVTVPDCVLASSTLITKFDVTAS